ncbi:unnamed protein product [Paramecium pentaurelia]|uniref:Uncharacterized protein n=1 Tax=Paramecium pentaurelia TaxID=43138 RepID=A0A8S1YF80_9CILI|nr:unnamed protein product [Paramecium pentaurelia]
MKAFIHQPSYLRIGDNLPKPTMTGNHNPSQEVKVNMQLLLNLIFIKSIQLRIGILQL